MKSTFPSAMFRLLYLCAGLVFALTAAGATFDRISVDNAGRERKGRCYEPTISADGQVVAFTSLAKFFDTDTNGKSDVFVRDRQTGLLRQVSDASGGEQPQISANGRFVLYRSLDDIPKVRLADLRGTESAQIISFPFDGARQSFRPGDLGVMSPDARFIAYVFRSRNGGVATHSILLHDHDAFRFGDPEPAVVVIEALADVRSLAISADGRLVVVATSDPLDLLDTNGTTDIYVCDLDADTVKWISDPEIVGGKIGASFDPVITPDGTLIAFLSNGELTAADSDGRETIYKASINDGFETLTAVFTTARPLSMAVDGISAGGVLGFLGRSGSTFPRSFVIDLATGPEISVTPRANRPSLAPAISLDGRTLAIASASTNFGFRDSNKSTDIFTTDIAAALGIPDEPPPSVTLTGVVNDQLVPAGNTIFPNVGANDPLGTILQTALSADERLLARVDGQPLNGTFTPARGFHTLLGTAFDEDWIEGQSDEVRIIAAPQFGITGAENLVTTPSADGGADFTASVRIDNRNNQPSANLRLLFLAVPLPVFYDLFGSEQVVLDALQARGDQERVLATIDVGPVAALSFASVPVSGVCPPPETVVTESNGAFQGIAWIIDAVLQEEVGPGNFQVVDRLEIFRKTPRLDEDTPGPNVGIPAVGDPVAAPGLNPQTLVSIAITGPTSVAEGTSAEFDATANYIGGSQPCQPAWSLENATGVATISSSGRLTAGNVSAPRQITVKAIFGGQQATKTVIIQPVSPVVSVRAAVKSALENSTGPRFKILRSSGTRDPLTVRYSVSGKATPGADYQALTGAVTLAAGASSAFVDVVPIDDATFEGHEDVRIEVLPSADHRLGSVRAASVTITDDEPAPNGQADALLKLGPRKVGAFIYDFFTPSTQTLTKRVAVKKTAKFTIFGINRGATASALTFQGPGDYLGFTVRYFSGRTEITADVTSPAGFAFAGVPPNEARQITAHIVPTETAPIGVAERCEVFVEGDTGGDVVEAVVFRVK